MEGLMKYKGTLVGVFLLVGLYFVYVNFIQGTGNDPLLTSTEVNGTDGTAAGQEIVQILSELNRIKLNTSIFENDSFNALVDRRKEIIPENVGRNNPFDPIGFGINRKGLIASPGEEVLQVIEIELPNTDLEPDTQ